MLAFGVVTKGVSVIGFLLHYGSKDLQESNRMAELPLLFFLGGT